eukprot:scaffold4139_cov72-Skeletonema_menzelii.AAC.5
MTIPALRISFRGSTLNTSSNKDTLRKMRERTIVSIGQNSRTCTVAAEINTYSEPFSSAVIAHL